MTKVILCLVIIWPATSSAFTNALGLFNSCNSNLMSDKEKCVFYLKGITEVTIQLLFEKQLEWGNCHYGTHHGKENEIFVNWLKSHWKFRYMSADGVAMRAFRNYWGCPMQDTPFLLRYLDIYDEQPEH